MSGGRKSTYDLGVIKSLVSTGSFWITTSALTDAFALGFDRYDIEACVLALDDSDLYKTMPAHSKTGFMQDVYKTIYQGTAIYLKLQVDNKAVVISFKEE